MEISAILVLHAASILVTFAVSWLQLCFGRLPSCSVLCLVLACTFIQKNGYDGL